MTLSYEELGVSVMRCFDLFNLTLSTFFGLFSFYFLHFCLCITLYYSIHALMLPSSLIALFNTIAS